MHLHICKINFEHLFTLRKLLLSILPRFDQLFVQNIQKIQCGWVGTDAMIQVWLKYKNVCYYLIGITWPVFERGGSQGQTERKVVVGEAGSCLGSATGQQGLRWDEEGLDKCSQGQGGGWRSPLLGSSMLPTRWWALVGSPRWALAGSSSTARVPLGSSRWSGNCGPWPQTPTRACGRPSPHGFTSDPATSKDYPSWSSHQQYKIDKYRNVCQYLERREKVRLHTYSMYLESCCVRCCSAGSESASSIRSHQSCLQPGWPASAGAESQVSLF